MISETCPRCGAPRLSREEGKIVNLAEWECGSSFSPMYETISLPQFIQSPSCMEKQIDLLKREIAHRNHIICDLQEQLQGADARIVSLKQQMLDAQLSVADAIRLVEEVLHGRK